jgi:hypothetical protein
VLDVITFRDAGEALGDTMSVIAIIAVAVALMAAVAAFGKRRSERPNDVKTAPPHQTS